MNTFDLMNQQVKAIHGSQLPDRFKDQIEYIERELDGDDKKKVLFVMPQSAGDVFLSTALFRSLKDTYSEYNLYVAPMNSMSPSWMITHMYTKCCCGKIVW